MNKKFKVGVIGVGFIGPAHMEAIRRLGFDVAALATSTQEKADRAAEELLIPKAYGDWRDLVNDPEVEVVHITSPNYLHYPQAKAALEAGKHVICEKPLAMDTEETAELVQLAQEKELVNAVNFNIRFYPLVQEAHAQVQAGNLGDQIYIIQGSYLQDWLLLETDWNWRIDPEEGGDLLAIADIGSHWVDLVTFITGTKVKEVCADLETFIPVRRKPTKELETFGGKMEVDQKYEEVDVELEEYGSVLLRFDNGSKGVMTISQVSSGRKNRLFFEINGSESSLIWNSERPNELLFGHRTKSNDLLIKDPALMSDKARWSASYPGGHTEGFPDTFKQLYVSVYEYIAAGDYSAEVNFPTFQDGHEIQAVDEAILKSSQENGWVEVEY